MKEQKIALFDMDGTLFDYVSQLKKDLKEIQSTEEKDIYEYSTLHDELPEYIYKRIDLIRKHNDWWFNLPKFQLGWDLWALTQELGFDHTILTKVPKSDPDAANQKIRCIRKHCGDKCGITIVDNTKHKAKANIYGNVLIDDYPPFVESWLKYRPRGFAILPECNDNKGYSHENSLIYDGTNLDEIKIILEAILKKEPKQHWKEII